MKTLENLKWSPKWVSHLGCLKGCLDYLGLEISDAWLYGGTGHAFIINMATDICPSGPTAWKTEMLFELSNNLGYEFDAVFGWKSDQGFYDLQKRAWEFSKEVIDHDQPAYGWELDVPEFYVIYGYDDSNYIYRHFDNAKGFKPWQELGDTGIGLIELYSVKPTQALEDWIIVKSAFQSVLKHAGNPEDWILENYASGVKGFDIWIKALESGTADRFGMGYNTEVWAECRKYAVEFLHEAKTRLVGKADTLFDEGRNHYQIVADRLSQVSQIYPFQRMEGIKITRDEKCQSAINLLKEARAAESAGLKVLEHIASEL